MPIAPPVEVARGPESRGRWARGKVATGLVFFLPAVGLASAIAVLVAYANHDPRRTSRPATGQWCS
jgi:hypothetical protein